MPVETFNRPLPKVEDVESVEIEAAAEVSDIANDGEVQAAPEQAAENPVNQVEASTSRVGDFMRSLAVRAENGANTVDAASERFTDMREAAKSKMRGFGRSALAHLKTAGLVTVGLGVMGAEATGRSVQKTVDVVETAGTAAIDTTGAKLKSVREKFNEFRENRRQAARERKDARHAKWRGRKETVVGAVKDGLNQSL